MTSVPTSPGSSETDTVVEALGPPVGTTTDAPVRAAHHPTDELAATTVAS